MHDLIANVGGISDKDDITTISFILPEDQEISSPKRISLLMDNVLDASELISEIYSIEEHSLSIVSCDSGSDKSFTFGGASSIIDKLKEFYLTIWEKIAFHKQEKRLRELKIVAETLPIFEKIGELHKKGTLDDHQVEKYKNKIESCMGTFLKIGAFTPEFEENSHLNPRLAMPPEKRLITDMRSSSEKPSEQKKGDKPQPWNTLKN